MGAIFRRGAPRPQSGTRRHQAAPRYRSEHLNFCYLSSTDSTQHTSTSCMTDCEDPLQSNLPLTTPLPRKSAPLPLLTLFLHSTHHISVRGMLTPSTLRRLNLVHRLLRNCLPQCFTRRLGLHPRRTARSSGSSINFLQRQTRRRLPDEKYFNR